MHAVLVRGAALIHACLPKLLHAGAQSRVSPSTYFLSGSPANMHAHAQIQRLLALHSSGPEQPMSQSVICCVGKSTMVDFPLKIQMRQACSSKVGARATQHHKGLL